MYRAIAVRAQGDELAAFFPPDAEQIEYPSLMRPDGHRRGLAEMRGGPQPARGCSPTSMTTCTPSSRTATLLPSS
jgi:hypothetical protein